MKAFIRENNVEFVESREPLSRYYPAGLLRSEERRVGKECRG